LTKWIKRNMHCLPHIYNRALGLHCWLEWLWFQFVNSVGSSCSLWRTFRNGGQRVMIHSGYSWQVILFLVAVRQSVALSGRTLNYRWRCVLDSVNEFRKVRLGSHTWNYRTHRVRRRYNTTLWSLGYSCFWAICPCSFTCLWVLLSFRPQWFTSDTPAGGVSGEVGRVKWGLCGCTPAINVGLPCKFPL
jgi:hypothetical protein